MTPIITPEWVLKNHALIPDVLLSEWHKRTGEYAFQAALYASRAQARRRTQGWLLLVVAACALAGIAFALLAKGLHPLLQGSFVIASFLLFVGTFFASLLRLQLKDPVYREFLRGFGWHFRSLSDYIDLPPADLLGWNLLERATKALDEKALAFVLTERELELGLRGRLERREWKFDPKWNEARKALERCYDVMEMFGLTEPVAKPSDAWKPYVLRAEKALSEEEDGALA